MIGNLNQNLNKIKFNNNGNYFCKMFKQMTKYLKSILTKQRSKKTKKQAILFYILPTSLE